MRKQIIPTIWVNFDSEFKKLLYSFNENNIDMVRINCTRHSIDEYIRDLSTLKEVYYSYIGKDIKLLLDIPVPNYKARVEYDWLGKEIYAEKGNTTYLTSNKSLIKKNNSYLCVSEKAIINEIKESDIITFGEDNPKFTVQRKNGEIVEMLCISDGVIPYGKYFTTNDIKFYKSPDSKLDEYRRLIAEVSPSVVALSFVSSARDIVETINKLEIKSDVEIMSKIESQEGVRNIEEILSVTNSVMIARGDLLISSGVEEFAHNIKRIEDLCNSNNIPFYVATGILESVISLDSNPTRAEIIDLYNIMRSNAEGLVLEYSKCKTASIFKHVSNLISNIKVK